MLYKVATVALLSAAALSGGAFAQDQGDSPSPPQDEQTPPGDEQTPPGDEPSPPGDEPSGPGGPPEDGGEQGGQQGGGPPGDCVPAAQEILGVAGSAYGELLGRLSNEDALGILTQASAAQNLLDDPITLFVPTDSALEEAGAADLTDAQLVEVLSLHVIQQPVTTDQIEDGATQSTLGGGELMFSTEGQPSVSVVGSAGPEANIIDPDIETCSGPIHVINQVLLPASIAGEADTMAPTMAPAPAPAMDGTMDGTRALGGPGDGPAEGPAVGPEAPCENVVDALNKDPDTELLGAIAAQVLDPDTIAVLTDPTQNLTVFAPPEDQLLKVLGGFQQGQIPQDVVANVIKTHVLTDFLEAEDLMEKDGEMLPTAAGADQTLEVMIEGDDVKLIANNTVTVEMPNLDGCSENAVIHKIDGIIVPEGVELDLAALPEGDPAALGDEALGPAGPAGTRDMVGDAVAPEAGSAHGVCKAVVAVAAAAVACVAAF